MPIRITVKGLTVRRAGRTLLDRVSLEAAPGRATVLMGPSGCGKSTLLRMLNRLDAEEHLFETEGSIHMDGEEILRPMGVWELAALRRRVGMVFQAPSPFPMSIGENIAYGQSSPDEVMTAWMNSAGHRANILNASFTKLGVGVYQSGGTLYWAQIFTY